MAFSSSPLIAAAFFQGMGAASETPLSRTPVRIISMNCLLNDFHSSAQQ